MRQFCQAVEKSGFTHKDTEIIARGKLTGTANAPILEVSGTSDRYTLSPTAASVEFVSLHEKTVTVGRFSIEENEAGSELPLESRATGTNCHFPPTLRYCLRFTGCCCLVSIPLLSISLYEDTCPESSLIGSCISERNPGVSARKRRWSCKLLKIVALSSRG